MHIYNAKVICMSYHKLKYGNYTEKLKPPVQICETRWQEGWIIKFEVHVLKGLLFCLEALKVAHLFLKENSIQIFCLTCNFFLQQIFYMKQHHSSSKCVWVFQLQLSYSWYELVWNTLLHLRLLLCILLAIINEDRWVDNDPLGKAINILFDVHACMRSYVKDMLLYLYLDD